MSRLPRVVICVATYRRPEGLARLLDGISELDHAAADVRLVIVDNSSDASTTRGVVDSFEGRLPPTDVLEESTQGISYARNRALDAVVDADFVAFIDDDEAPSQRWLRELLRVQRECDADVVTGPVLPRFEQEPADWITEGRFFEGERHATGTQLDLAFTGNVLVRWERFARVKRFSPRYARSGSSDTHFFRSLHRDGASIVWADDAEVYEWQPPSRQHVSWILKRQYRIGLTCALIDEELPRYPNPRRRILKEARVRMTDGIRWLARSPLGPKHEQVRALARMAAAVGRVAALVGLQVEEYRR